MTCLKYWNQEGEECVLGCLFQNSHFASVGIWCVTFLLGHSPIYVDLKRRKTWDKKQGLSDFWAIHIFIYHIHIYTYSLLVWVNLSTRYSQYIGMVKTQPIWCVFQAHYIDPQFGLNVRRPLVAVAIMMRSRKGSLVQQHKKQKVHKGRRSGWWVVRQNAAIWPQEMNAYFLFQTDGHCCSF